MLRYANVLSESLVDGVGLRVAVFLQGCPRRCEGCHNQALLDPAGGTAIGAADMAELLLSQVTPLHDGITFSGGDPLLQQEKLISVIQRIRACRPEMNIWVYTGYMYEEVAHLPLLQWVDVLVDGPFELEKRDLRLPFRGSSNQRIVDVPASRRSGKVQLLGGKLRQTAC